MLLPFPSPIGLVAHALPPQMCISCHRRSGIARDTPLRSIVCGPCWFAANGETTASELVGRPHAPATELPESASQWLCKRVAPACTGPITVADRRSAEIDMVNLTSAVRGRAVVGTFTSAASPGVVSLFFANHHYRTHEEYLFAIADAMRHEYETIAAAGTVVQIDCPDLAMGRHVQFADLDLAEFRKRITLHVEALNHAVAGIPAEQLRMHLCWGNYPGPHHRDVPLADIIDIVWRARPSTVLFEAANPRHAHEWALFEDVRVPDGKVMAPGVIECQSHYIEHPEVVAQRIERYARLIGRENVIAAVDCGFSIHVGQSGVDPTVVWAKLAALAEGAALASERCWP